MQRQQESTTEEKSVKNKTLGIIEKYCRFYPSLHDISLSEGISKCIYQYYNPFTNSSFFQYDHFPIQPKNQDQLSFIDYQEHELVYDQIKQTVSMTNSEHQIRVQQFHGPLIQDYIFGKAMINSEKNRWVYIAQCKPKTCKSYFLGGIGKDKYSHDFGEGYQGINNIGIFVWDLNLNTVNHVSVKSKKANEKYIVAKPIFGNVKGTQIVCHVYIQTQFVSGLECLNIPAVIMAINNKSQAQEWKIQVISKNHRTNIIPGISKCYNYLYYLRGDQKTHAYYMDIIILHRQNSQQQKWIQAHTISKAWVGYYNNAKFESFEINGQPFFIFTAVEKAKSILKIVNLKTAQVTTIQDKNILKSYTLLKINHQERKILGRVDSFVGSNFFYLPFGGKIKQIPQNRSEQIKAVEYLQPIHGYFLNCHIKENQSDNKKPMVVILHGGPHGFAGINLDILKYTFLQSGFCILLPNYPGSISFGQCYLQQCLGQIGSSDVKQIVNLINTVIKQNQYIDKEKVYVMGNSYGGYLTRILASQYPSIFKSAVISNGVYSIMGLMWFTCIPQWVTVEALGQFDYHNLSAQQYQKIFNLSFIDKIPKIPTMQFVGGKDMTVYWKQGLVLESRVKKSNGKFETYLYQNGSHYLESIMEDWIDIIIKIIVFFRQSSQGK